MAVSSSRLDLLVRCGVFQLKPVLIAWHALIATCQLQKVERLRSQLHFIGAATSRQHVVFVDDEAAVQSFSPEQHFDTASELLDRSYNRPRTAHLQQPAATGAVPDGKQRQQSER